ncbi:MAG: WG repeat-containing protein [Moraxella sp.]|nr:WG repeat-containing protein [Moraxella sp.]
MKILSAFLGSFSTTKPARQHNTQQNTNSTNTTKQHRLAWLIGITLLAFSENSHATAYCKPPPNALTCLSSGLAPSYQHANKQWGYVDITGAYVLSAEFDSAGDFVEGLAAVSKDGKAGFINPKGEMVIAADYEMVGDFSEGLAAVIKNGKLGYINTTGEVVVRPQYQANTNLLLLHAFHEGLAAVQKNNQWGFINKTGKVVIPIRYAQVGRFYEGLAKFVQDDKMGFLNKAGKIIIQAQYDVSTTHDELVTGFDNDVATVRLEEAYGVIDSQNHIIVPFNQYRYIGNYHNSLAVFANHDDKYGYLSHTGEVMLPAVYDLAYDFVRGYGVVEDWVFEERFRVDKTPINP